MYTLKHLFHGIKYFINQLWIEFGDKTKISPLALYKRLCTHIKYNGNEIAIQKSVKNFEDFFLKFEQEDYHYVFPEGTHINYGQNKKIYISIDKFFLKSDDETMFNIRKHLLYISTILNPNVNKMKILNTHFIPSKPKDIYPDPKFGLANLFFMK